MQSIHDRVRLANLLSLLYWSGLSKGEFSQRILVQQPYLSLIFSGRRNIGSRLAQRIEIAFEKEPGWLDIDRSACFGDEHYRVLFGQLPRDLQNDVLRLIEHLSIVAAHRPLPRGPSADSSNSSNSPHPIANKGQ